MLKARPASGITTFRVSYLQAFYFSLEAENEVFHVAAVQALLALFFGCCGAFGTAA